MEKLKPTNPRPCLIAKMLDSLTKSADLEIIVQMSAPSGCIRSLHGKEDSEGAGGNNEERAGSDDRALQEL